MKKEIWKRMLCVATATVVCLTSIPGTVFADETGCKEARVNVESVVHGTTIIPLYTTTRLRMEYKDGVQRVV